MHFIYGKCRGNKSEAAMLYRRKYPNVSQPEYYVFIRVHTEPGRKNCYPKRKVKLNKNWGQSVHFSKTNSTADWNFKIEWTEATEKKTSTVTIMTDYTARLLFCDRCMWKYPQFLNNILCSDESAPKKDGYYHAQYAQLACIKFAFNS